MAGTLKISFTSDPQTIPPLSSDQQPISTLFSDPQPQAYLYRGSAITSKQFQNYETILKTLLDLDKTAFPSCLPKKHSHLCQVPMMPPLPKNRQERLPMLKNKTKLFQAQRRHRSNLDQPPDIRQSLKDFLRGQRHKDTQPQVDRTNIRREEQPYEEWKTKLKLKLAALQGGVSVHLV